MTPESLAPKEPGIQMTGALHEQFRTHKVITKDEIVVMWFFLNYQQFYYKNHMEVY